MFNDPEKGLQWRFIGVDDAQAEEVEMDGAGEMILGEVFGRPQIDQKRLPVALQLTRKVAGRNEKIRVRMHLLRAGVVKGANRHVLA